MHHPATNLTDLLLDMASALRELAKQAEHVATALALATPSDAHDGHSDLDVDRDALAVRWKGHSCFLGYTTAFRLIERLAQRPNNYLSHAQLLEDVWGGARSSSAIRSAVNDLRDRLTRAGMPDLAAAIDGSNPGHYGLITSRPA